MKTSFLIFAFITYLSAQDTLDIKLSIQVGEAIKKEFTNNGRLYIFLSDKNRNEPRFQIWPTNPLNAAAINLEHWDGGAIHFDQNSKLFIHGKNIFSDPMNGTYFLQALWDQDVSESRINAPGNLYSQVDTVEWGSKVNLRLNIDQIIPPRTHQEHRHVKYINMVSDTLSKWWNKPMSIKAAVLLPATYHDNPTTKFPIRYNVAGYGGRYDRVARLVGNQEFADWWFREDAPQIINIFLDGEGPFGDSYQLDSENSGPYGYALTRELIPQIENQFRAIGTTETRFVDGCSTGGWVSLALQVFYPEVFGGTWSFSPDPVDFHHMQLINIYENENAFINSNGYLRPSMRSVIGEPVFSIKQEIATENLSGPSNTFVTSGGQWGAWNALYSPKRKDGLPEAIFDPYNGTINQMVAEYWRKYDIHDYLKTNWAEVGPRLEGKIYVWMGDMDQFYLNNAMRSLDKFLKNTHAPVSDAIIEFTPQKGHCSNYSHRKVLEMMDQKLQQE